MELNWLSISLIIAAAHGIFLCVILFGKQYQQERANSFLQILLISIVLSLLLRLTYSESNAIFIRFPHLTIAGDFALFIIGPTLYLYVQYLLKQKANLQVKDSIHIVPLLLFVLWFGYLLSFTRTELLNYHITGQINIHYIILMNSAMLLLAIYGIMGLQIINTCISNQKIILKESIQYLRLILGALLGVVVCWFLGHIYSIIPSYNSSVSNLIYQISFILMSSLVFIIGFYAIQEPKIFRSKQQFTQSKTKYHHSALNPTDSQQIYAQLLQHFEKTQPYLNPKLSLQQLALSLNTNQVYLSQVINEQSNKNFYSFVNNYRVEAFIKMATDPANQHLTLIAIAQQSGFGTKTSFNKAFKKIKGSTPSQFLKTFSKA